MRGLARGESYRLTSRGRPVGVLTPLGRTALDEHTLRAGTQEMTFPDAVPRAERVLDALDDQRGES